MVKICMQKTINNWIIKVIEEVTILALLWENISASTTVHSSKDLKVAFVLFFDVQNKVLSLQQQVVSIAPPYGRILSRDRLPYPVNLYAHITRVPFHIRSGHRPDRHSATRKEEWGGGRESRRATELFDWKEIRRGGDIRLERNDFGGRWLARSESGGGRGSPAIGRERSGRGRRAVACMRHRAPWNLFFIYNSSRISNIS